MNSFITWIGGKKLLRETVVSRFSKEGIQKYVEVFGGADWVLLHQNKHALKEVYNDINSNLVNLFCMMKHHTKAMMNIETRNIVNILKYEIKYNCKRSRGKNCGFYVKISKYGTFLDFFRCIFKSIKCYICRKIFREIF